MQNKMMKELLYKDKGMHELLPQRAPIVMVDKFFGMTDESSYSGLTVREENIFCHDGILQEAGIIEHIAQSAAARIGYIYIQKGESVPLGFIGSVDKMVINSLPLVGDELYTQITVLQEVFEITLVSAQVKSNDKVIAECRMKIFLKK